MLVTIRVVEQKHGAPPGYCDSAPLNRAIRQEKRAARMLRASRDFAGLRWENDGAARRHVCRKILTYRLACNAKSFCVLEDRLYELLERIQVVSLLLSKLVVTESHAPSGVRKGIKTVGFNELLSTLRDESRNVDPERVVCLIRNTFAVSPQEDISLCLGQKPQGGSRLSINTEQVTLAQLVFN